MSRSNRLTGNRIRRADARRWFPDPEVVKADIVLLAMGFLKPQLPEVGENVFFAGDVWSGASLVVRAMASGHAAAESVDAYFNKVIK